jgi:hypothetical protein
LSAKRLSEQMREKSAKPHTLPGCLGREKRFGYTFQNFARHSNAFVANEEAHSLRDRLNGFQGYGLTTRAGIERILHEGG